MESNSTTVQKDPAIVYKYRDWNNNLHRPVLINNQIYLPSPKELNDPFDFQIKLDFDLINTQEKIKEFIELYFKNENSSSNKYLCENHSNLIVESYKKNFHNIQYEAYSKHFGVFCLSGTWENILMWSHYSKNHSGFCIGFNKDKLLETKFFSTYGMVKYSADYPILNPIESIKFPTEIFIHASYSKSIDWKYEKEYRFLKFWYPQNPPFENRLYTINQDCINEVILGLNISIENENEIRTICESKNISVYKIRKSDSQFILERDRL